MSIECVTNGDLAQCFDGPVTNDIHRALWKAAGLGNTQGAITMLTTLISDLETEGVSTDGATNTDRRYAAWLRERRGSLLAASGRQTTDLAQGTKGGTDLPETERERAVEAIARQMLGHYESEYSAEGVTWTDFRSEAESAINSVSPMIADWARRDALLSAADELGVDRREGSTFSEGLPLATADWSSHHAEKWLRARAGNVR